MRLYGLLGGGGGQVRIHVQSTWQTRGVRGHAPPGFWTFYQMQFGEIWDCFRTNIIYH